MGYSFGTISRNLGRMFEAMAGVLLVSIVVPVVWGEWWTIPGLVVAIERGDDIVTPRGNTTVHAGELVTVFSKEGISGDVMRTFVGEEGVSSETGRVRTAVSGGATV